LDAIVVKLLGFGGPLTGVGGVILAIGDVKAHVCSRLRFKPPVVFASVGVGCPATAKVNVPLVVDAPTAGKPDVSIE